MASCTKDEASMYKHRILPVKEIKAPKEFEFGRVATITIAYELPNTCSYFFVACIMNIRELRGL